MSRLTRAFPYARLGVCCALVAMSLAARPEVASAQECVPGSIDPETAPGPGNCPPEVFLSYAPGAVPVVSLELTVYWSTPMDGLNAASRSILVGTSEVRAEFSYDTLETDDQGRVTLAMSTGILTLPADGSPVTLTAAICTTRPRCSTPVSASYRYQVPPLVIAVQNSVAKPRDVPLLETFRLVNRASSPLTYTLTGVCDGPVTRCSPSAHQVTISAGDTVVVGVNYMMQNGGSLGSVGLTVSDGTGSGFASTNWLAMVSAGPPGGVGDRTDLTLISRATCVTASIGGGAAYECGDLRLVHPLPTTRVLSKARTPVLIYNSQHARPTPIVAAHVSRDLAAPPPDSLHAVLTVAAVTAASQWYRGAITDTVRRVALSFDASSMRTGLYGYTLEVTAYYPTGTAPAVIYTRNGRLSIVNRVNSPFGRGWWLAGLESLVPISEDEMLWVAGDGSTRRYTPTYDGTGWAGPLFDRPDTIRTDPVTGWFKRPLPGGDTVFFDAVGRHVKTRTARRDSTLFVYNDTTLTQIKLPAGTAGGTSLAYTFNYTGGSPSATTGMLAEVVAPSPDGSSNLGRVVRLETIGRNVNRIYDPIYRQDSPAGAAFDPGRPHVLFGVGNGRYVSRTSRDSVPTFFRYDAAGLLSGTALGLAAGDSIKLSFRPAESQGLSAAVRDTAVYTRIDGPRTDSADVIRYYLDRWGAPVKVVDSYGYYTTLARALTTLPALVTNVRYHNGRQVSSSYDSRGRLISTTDFSMFDVPTQRYATTVYDYDLRFDQVRRVMQSEGETSTTSYDAYGRPEWSQQGPSSAGRVTFLYNSLTTPSTAGPGLVRAVRLPATSSQAVADVQFEYDALGNTSATVSPGLVRAEVLGDNVGRPTRVRTQIDTSAAPKFKVDSTTYDINDRVVRTESVGPQVVAGARTVAQQRSILRNEYDLEGRIRAVIRRPEANEGGVDSIITRWRYDRAGRAVAEYAPDQTPAIPYDGPRDTARYNPAGLPEWNLTRRGDTTTTVYDAMNRVRVRYNSAYTYAPRYQGLAALHPTCSAGPPYSIRHPYPAQPTNPSDCTYRIAGDTVRLAYDEMGNVKTATNTDARVSRSYYQNGQIRGDTLRIRTTAGIGVNDTHKYVLGYQYDLNGRRIVLTHPGQLGPTTTATTRYAYNAETGGLETVTDPLGNVFRYDYDGRGQLRALTLPAGIVHGYSYDAEGRMSLYTLDLGVGGRISQTHYRYDARSKLLASHNDVGAQDDFTAAYSGIGHLVASAHSTSGMTQGFNAIFERNTADYWADALGNGWKAVTGSGSQTRSDGWGPLNGSSSGWGTTGGTSTYESMTGRLLSSTQGGTAPAGSFTQTFFYDPSGNTVFQEGADAVNQADVAHFYGADGKLRAVDRRNSARTGDPYTAVWEEYRYDALGRRVWVRTQNECGGTFNDPRCAINPVRRTVWDGDQALYEIQMQEGEAENDGNPTQTSLLAGGAVDPRTSTGRVLHTYGPGIDQPLSVIRMGYVGLSPFAVIPLWDSDGRAPYLVFANGSRCLTSSCGLNTIWAVGNRPYGSKANGYVYADGDFENRLVWLGNVMRDQHDASGLLYRRNRYYDPQTGRFTQEDPIGLAGGMNLYGFADGDPVGNSDPFGLTSCSDLRAAITRTVNVMRRRVSEMLEARERGGYDLDHLRQYDGWRNRYKNQMQQYQDQHCWDDDDDDDFRPTIQRGNALQDFRMPAPQLLRNPRKNPAIPVPPGTPMPPRTAPLRMVRDATDWVRPPTPEQAAAMSLGALMLLVLGGAAMVATGP
jgi:RHS repeat-associated protein